MRPIGHIADAEQARRFTDFLAAQGMATDTDREDDGRFLVWIVEEEHLEAAKAQLVEFVGTPEATKFRGHDGSLDRMRQSEAEENAAYARRIRTRKSLMPRMTSYRLGPLTFALISACIAVGVYTGVYALFGMGRDIEQWLLIEAPGKAGFLAAVLSGEVWRLWSPIFLHFGLLHIVFNMMWLFSLGSMIEARCGTWKLAALVVVVGLLSNLAQRLVGSVTFGGMSGVVYALIGYVWIRGRRDPASGVGLDKQSWIMALVWLVVCMTGWIGPIANTAHFSGLVLGLAWGWIDAARGVRRHG